MTRTDSHQDLLYYKEPPKLQILHCLKQSDEGGESLFSDSFRAVRNFYRRNFPITTKRISIAHALMTFKVPFHYKNNGHWLWCFHPTLTVDQDMVTGTSYGSLELNNDFLDVDSFCNDTLQAVRWSPPFQAPIGRFSSAPEPGLDQWITGARLLREEFQRPSSIYQTKLEEGTCVIFDNSRILHARKAFSSSERWLRGAYIDETTFTQQILRLDSTWRRDALS